MFGVGVEGRRCNLVSRVNNRKPQVKGRVVEGWENRVGWWPGVSDKEWRSGDGSRELEGRQPWTSGVMAEPGSC